MEKEFIIFYTDDDQDDIEFFREILNGFSNRYTLVTQNNGEELLYALDNPPPHPHLIFLDINMPGLNGLEVLKRLRASGKHNNVPVIMFSTSSDEATIKKSRELGATFYLPKSNMFEKLKSSVEDALSINWSSFTPTDANFVYNFH